MSKHCFQNLWEKKEDLINNDHKTDCLFIIRNEEDIRIFGFTWNTPRNRTRGSQYGPKNVPRVRSIAKGKAEKAS